MPAPRCFVVETGTAVFTAGNDELPSRRIVIVLPEAPRCFKNPSDDSLHVLSVHPSPAVQ